MAAQTNRRDRQASLCSVSTFGPSQIKRVSSPHTLAGFPIFVCYNERWGSQRNIPLGKEIAKEFPQYALYVYGEGPYAAQLRGNRFQGVPVLFIPGNAGSYKQARSLGSVALRMSEKVHNKVHFNYFVVDFNEELSGLFGGVLARQTEFVNYCLKKIMALYSGTKSQPSTVVLVGHSMGGMIARALFTIPEFDKSLVNTIITQATPHQKPVAAIDIKLKEFYTKVNEYWRKNGDKELRHVAVVSTGGGDRDTQVRYGLTSLEGIVAPDREVSVSTTSIPKAWVSTDHLCAVWCRQMVLLTQKALFDIVDKATLKVSNDADMRMKVFQHHFLSYNGLPDYLTHQENKTITLDPKVKWNVKSEKLSKINIPETKSSIYFAIPLMDEEGFDSIIIITNLTNPEWICYCDIPEGQKQCSSCTSLSAQSEFLPPLYSNTKYRRISHTDIPVTIYTHIVLLVPAGQKKVDITSDRYNSYERHLVYHMPNTYDTIISYPVSVTDGAAMLKISNSSAFYSLHLAGLSLPTTAYRAMVIPQGCRRYDADTMEGSVLRLNIPWSNEDTYTFAGYGKELEIAIKLRTGRPKEHDFLLDSSEPHLEMYLHPYCHYQLRLLAATHDALGQAVRFYMTLLPGYFLAVLLMTLGGAISMLGKGQAVSTSLGTPATALIQHAKPYYVLPFSYGLTFLVSFGPITKFLANMGIPRDDSQALKEENIWFKLLPFMLYLCTWMMAYLQSFIVFNVLSVFSYLGCLISWMPESISSKTKYAQLAISVMAVMSTYLCGTVSMMFMSALLILKVLHLVYLIGRKLDTNDTHRKLAIFFPIMLMINLQALLSLSPFIIWVKTAIHSRSWLLSLESDHSRLPALAMSISVSVILFKDSVELSRLQSSVASGLLSAMSVLTLVYAMESMYRIPVLVAAAVGVISVASLLPEGLSRERTKKE